MKNDDEHNPFAIYNFWLCNVCLVACVMYYITKYIHRNVNSTQNLITCDHSIYLDSLKYFIVVWICKPYTYVSYN